MKRAEFWRNIGKIAGFLVEEESFSAVPANSIAREQQRSQQKRITHT
jgi:hypothetical protein